MQVISSLLKNFEKKYKHISSVAEEISILNPTAVTDAELDNYQNELGFEFSQDLRELYKLSDGTISGSDGEPYNLFFTHAFNPIETSIRIHKELQEFNKTARQSEYDVTLQGRLYTDYYFNYKLGAIKHLEFHPHWYPLGSIRGMSTYIMVDHSPGSKGSYGQVIFIDLRRKAIVLADSIEGYLKKITKHAKYISKQEDDYKIMLRIATGSIWRSMSY